MKNTNIVKLDRTTVQEFLPILTNRGVFSNYDNLPKKDEILEKEKKRLGKAILTLAEKRAVLSKVGRYRSKAHVIRDYGDYVIAFSAKMYLDNLMKTEEELKDVVLREEYSEDRIQAALKKINTYKLAHKIALIILSEVYKQNKHVELIISKQQLLTSLGYTASEKHIYSHIKEAMYSLHWLDYIIYNYKTKLKFTKDSKTTGNFIYNLYEDSTEYKLWVNPLFVGCAIHMAEDGSKLSTEEHKQLFKRGYLEYPINYVAESKDGIGAAYFLGHYLLTQNGHAKLSTIDHKVIAITVEKLLSEAHIEHSRPDVRVNSLLKALEEIAPIQHIDPPIEALRKRKAKRVEEMILHIYLPQQNKKSTPKRAKKV